MFHSHLESILQDYWFTEKEAKIYLTILELGNAGVSTISRRSWVKRVTIYSILENLWKKTIVQETEVNWVKNYSVISPQKIFKEYEEKFKNFRKHLPELMDLPETFGNAPKIQFFDGKENVDQMLYDYSDIWIKSMAQYDQTWWGFFDADFLDYYMPWLEWYRAKKVPWESINMISNWSDTEDKIAKEREKKNNRVVKKIPGWLQFDSSLWINWDYIIMIMTKEKRHYAYQIQEKLLARNLREVFKLLWNNHWEKINK